MVNRQAVIMQIQRSQVMSCQVCGLKICISRHQLTLGSAMSCGRKFSASVVNAAIVNRNSKGLYTCKCTRDFTLQPGWKYHFLLQCGTVMASGALPFVCTSAEATTASVLLVTAM